MPHDMRSWIDQLEKAGLLSRITKAVDPRTQMGALLWQARDRALLFVSYRDGAAQLYDVEYPDGDIRQMTDGPGIHPFSPALDPNAGEIVFTRGAGLWAIDCATLVERQIVDFGDTSAGEPSTTSTSTRRPWLTAATASPS